MERGHSQFRNGNGRNCECPRSGVRHAGALALFAGLTLVWLWPLAGRWGDAIPGAGPGDNVVFVWNVWWTRYALLHSLSPLHSPLLLYPFGADLTLHTHTLLPALLVAFVRNPVTAQNILIALHLWLNFACAYALAWRVTRSWSAATVGALAFGWSPYVGAHLGGHFNLIAAWVLPLIALAALRAAERPTYVRGITLGAALAATAYVDYYYLVFGGLIAVLLLVARAVTVRARGERPSRGVRRLELMLAGTAALACAIALGIAATGGGTLQAGGARISMRSAWNPVAAAWIATTLMVFVHGLTRVRVSLDRATLRRVRPAVAGSAAIVVLGLAPLGWSAARLIAAGGYASQHYAWRSAPAGVDLATLVTGNPYGALAGRASAAEARALHADTVEGVAWISPGLLILAAIGLRHRRDSRRWILVLLCFGLWALGPLLRIAGLTTPLWLPAIVIRWIPFVANARIPSRAMIGVYLACAMLAAIGMKRMIGAGRSRASAACASILVLDLAPAPPPITHLPRPAVVEVLRARPQAGAVLEVPLGLRDGFGETGRLDPAAMWLATLHERPIAGGFVARLDPHVTDEYRSIPVLGSLLRLSAGAQLTDAAIAADTLQGGTVADLGFRFVLLDTRLASTEAREYVERVLPVSRVATDGDYVLYTLDR